MEKRAVLKNYGLLGAMLAAMLTGGVTGWLWPAAAGTSARWGKFSSISCSAWWCRWCFPPSPEPSPGCGTSAGPGASWASQC
ncbi:MAG: hypothetical protein ACLR39_03390 [Oscillospiraceae bacterium]